MAELKFNSGINRKGLTAGTMSDNLAKSTLASIENGSHPIVNPNEQGLMRTSPIVMVEENRDLGIHNVMEKGEDGKWKFDKTEINYTDLANKYKAEMFLSKIGGTGYLVSEDTLKKSGLKLNQIEGKDGKKWDPYPLTLETIVREDKVGKDGAKVQAMTKDGTPMVTKEGEPIYEKESKVKETRRFYDISQCENPDALLKAGQKVWIDEQTKKLQEAGKEDKIPDLNKQLRTTNMNVNSAVYPDPYKEKPNLTPEEYVANAIAWQNAASLNRLYLKIEPETSERLKEAFKTSLGKTNSKGEVNMFNMEQVIRIATKHEKGQQNMAEMLNLKVMRGIKGAAKEKEKEKENAPAIQKQQEMGIAG